MSDSSSRYCTIGCASARHISTTTSLISSRERPNPTTFVSTYVNVGQATTQGAETFAAFSLKSQSQSARRLYLYRGKGRLDGNGTAPPAYKQGKPHGILERDRSPHRHRAGRSTSGLGWTTTGRERRNSWRPAILWSISQQTMPSPTGSVYLAASTTSSTSNMRIRWASSGRDSAFMVA